jgi:hypothetical protein
MAWRVLFSIGREIEPSPRSKLVIGKELAEFDAALKYGSGVAT